jgi:hypothetical protein
VTPADRGGRRGSLQDTVTAALNHHHDDSDDRFTEGSENDRDRHSDRHGDYDRRRP